MVPLRVWALDQHEIAVAVADILNIVQQEILRDD